MFKEYESKPVTRLAMKITEDMTLDVVGAGYGDNTTMRCTYMSDIEKSQIEFKHHQPVEVGDYIVHLTDDDVYHSSAEVFAERNIIPEGL